MLLTPRLEKAIKKLSEEYVGDLGVLESAVGAVLIAQLYGWKVLRMCHGSNAYAKYERMLGIKFKDECPETTKLSRKSLGLWAAERINDFWAVVKGAQPGRSKEIVELERFSGES